ncbi:MAG TPA: helix-turn-helix transcriptional regulator [Solirubrobacterales bacterium]|nr:helix-turn-helix transcriptional regulator [Solirubrobacterales bacterium]
MSSRDPQKALGNAIAALRRRAELTQDELAAHAEVEPSLVAGIEAGEADPTWGDARRIAAALGTSVDRLAALVEELEAGGGR